MKPNRLSAELARAFLAKLGKHIQRNVNIMDREGVIIASGDPGRLGTYHEAAYNLIVSGGTEEDVDIHGAPAPGVRPGVNLPILLRGETVGVVGVTGDPREIRELAYAVKISVESMAELELVKDHVLIRQSGRHTLVGRLINPGSGNAASLKDAALRMGYVPEMFRAPVLLSPLRGDDPEGLWRELKGRGIRDPQDIGAPTADGDLLVFRRMEPFSRGILGSFEDQISSFFTAVKSITEIRTFSGMFQRDLSRYHLAYRQAVWLRSRYSLSDSALTGPILITRHLSEYLVSLVPSQDFVALFESLDGLKMEEDHTKLLETLRVLGENNFNVGESSSALHLHRNTVSSRLEKIIDLLGIDPRLNPSAREYLKLLSLHWNTIMHDAQKYE